MQKLFFDKKHVNHYILFSVDKDALTFDKNFIATTHQVTYLRKFYFSVCFLSFFRFFGSAFWPIETTAANLQGLTHSNPGKCFSQVTLSNELMNYLFWA